MDADQPAGTVAFVYLRRPAIHPAPPCGRHRTANHSREPLDRAASAAGFQHFDGPHLVRASESFFLGRSAATQKAGSILGRSAGHRRRADQPQSLRPPGSTRSARAGGSWKFYVYCSGSWRSPASLAEHWARSRVGLGRNLVVARVASGLHNPLRPSSAFFRPGDFRP